MFSMPQPYIRQIIDNVSVPKEKRKVFAGKSLASIFLTKFCDAGCSHCFFKSGKDKTVNPQEQCEFSDYGFERFVEFINASNNGYLLVIGGGEPFKKLPYVMEIVKRVNTDRLILVTNGMWGQTYDNAKKVIFDLYDCYKQRKTPTKLILRLSVDKWHIKQIGYDLIDNIINVFKEFFKEETDFELQIHTLIGDPSLEQIAARRKDFQIIRTHETGISDNEEIIKISPYRCRMNFNDGYVIYVGIARTFYSTLKPNLKDPNPTFKKALQIFDEDMEFSAFDNPSVILNKDGSLGLNFWVNYNGNVALWGNQQLTDLKNVYVDDYESVIKGAFENIIAYSFLDKGYKNRIRIIDEVNHQAVIRSKAINIRDYAGASILEEKKTVLYYAIRVIQDYLKDEILHSENLGNLPLELKEVISLDRDALKIMYKQSDYTIISEYMERTKFIEDDWKDLFVLIKLGHYDVSTTQIRKAINYFNQYAKTPISDINDITCSSSEHYDRLNNRLTFMKQEALEWCTQNK